MVNSPHLCRPSSPPTPHRKLLCAHPPPCSVYYCASQMAFQSCVPSMQCSVC
jgi:hypothetical protein